MNQVNNIIKFHTKEKDKIGLENKNTTNEDLISYPTSEEIYIINSLVEQYANQNPDQMVPYNMWNGDCYKTIYKEMSAYAKEIQADPWDVFALFINKIHGLKIEEDEDGSVTVKYRKD